LVIERRDDSRRAFRYTPTNVNLTANAESVLMPTTISIARFVFSYDAIGPHR
jgi:hypothetical protein